MKSTANYLKKKYVTFKKKCISKATTATFPLPMLSFMDKVYNKLDGNKINYNP